MPLDILEHLLDLMTKADAFRLSQTCKTFMWHPIVLKAIFHEPISLREIELWYRQLPDCGMNTKLMMGPPVTWGINTLTGPLVRRLAIPEWISELDIHYITTFCPNLHAVDFTEIFKPVPHPVGWDSDEDSDEDLDSDEEEGGINYWPSMLDRCPALFRNLRSVHLPYGCWRMVYSRMHSYQQTHLASLPRILRLADRLQTLELTCQHEPTLDPSPESRREASAKLLAEIQDNVSRGLTTLALYESESTIGNLDSFLQSLEIFPKLRAIKLSLHRDLQMYEKDSQSRYGFDRVISPISSGLTKEYEHDTASVLQYLSTIKKINDRGRFSLVSSDCGETYHSTPRDYYGLCHTELVHGPTLWTPVWTWNDRLNWVRSQKNARVEVVDTGRCRALFEELTKARIPVSVELEPVNVHFGAFFASCWDEDVSHRHYDNAGIPFTGHFQAPPGSATIAPMIRNRVEKPKQHFIQQRVLTSTTSTDPRLYHGMPKGFDHQRLRTVSVNFPVAEDNHEDSLEFHHQPLADSISPPREGKSNAKPYIDSAASNEADAKTDLPDPVWRLNEIGDLVDDLRLIWHRGFAYIYARSFGQYCDPNPNYGEWSMLIHKCKPHLRGRFWRESEFTALLFRRIPVDFPRLTRLALYIPAALYPNHDQTFIDRALPGTGWTVRHYGRLGGAPPIPNLNQTCLKLADDICPFIRRIFTRPTPTDDPSAVIVHDEEWHRTKRPLFDLDGEYKSMEQLLTEPLRVNYTEGGDGRETRINV